MQTVIYISNAVDELTKLERNIESDSPAATNKVIAISRAINSTGANSIILSLGRGRQNGTWKLHGSTTKKVLGVDFFYATFLHARFFTHFVSAFSLMLILVKLFFAHKKIYVIFYNRCYHYFPAALMAKLLFVPCYLDLEDGYNNSCSNRISKSINFFVEVFFNKICSCGAMVATSQLTYQVGCKQPYICYGVAEDVGLPINDWRSDHLQIIFSGTLLEEVGSELLLEAIDILRSDYLSDLKKIFFVVTGKGPCSGLFEAYAKIHPETLIFHKSLPIESYLGLLRASHVGISLRLSKYEMGATTFPSKVIEYANNGLAVLSTYSSDVPALFGDAAVYLNQETPVGLAKLIASLPSKKNDLMTISLLGKQKIREKCNPNLVGQNIVNLISNGL